MGCDSACLHQHFGSGGRRMRSWKPAWATYPISKRKKERMSNNLPPPGFSQSIHHLLGLDRHVLRDKYPFVVVHWFLASGQTTGLCGLAAAPEVQG